MLLLFSNPCYSYNEELAQTRALEALFIQTGVNQNVEYFIKKQENKYISPKYRELFGNSLWLIETIVKQRIEVKVRF